MSTPMAWLLRTVGSVFYGFAVFVTNSVIPLDHENVAVLIGFNAGFAYFLGLGWRDWSKAETRERTPSE